MQWRPPVKRAGGSIWGRHGRDEDGSAEAIDTLMSQVRICSCHGEELGADHTKPVREELRYQQEAWTAFFRCFYYTN